jgi:PAS domain-containing protein
LKQNGAEIVAKVFETALIQRIPEFAYERRDGTVQYMDLTFLPYSNDDGVVTAIIVFAQKATENKIPRQ